MKPAKICSMELLWTIKRYFIWDIWNEATRFKEEIWCISAADTYLNLGENFENWCTEFSHEQLRPHMAMWRGWLILQTFFATILLHVDTCHNSFPAWTAPCQKRNTPVTANLKCPEQILPGGGAGAWVGHHLIGAAPIKPPGSSTLLKHKDILPAKITGWVGKS